jgi:hypothetical protein
MKWNKPRARAQKGVMMTFYMFPEWSEEEKRRTHHRLFEQIFTAWGGVKRGRRAVSLISLHIIFMRLAGDRPEDPGNCWQPFIFDSLSQSSAVYVFVCPGFSVVLFGGDSFIISLWSVAPKTRRGGR